jgi:hypothetical protein
MAATIGPSGVDLYASPVPDLLHEASGITPVEADTHVMLAQRGIQAAQRLALSDVGGKLVVALWPAELKEQAIRLYGRRRATPMISTARERGWTVEASPQLAFWNSPSSLRLYLAPSVDPAEYARRWQEGDLERVGAYDRAQVDEDLWPWLKERAYATDNDDAVLDLWLATRLGNRRAFLRPALRLQRMWPPGALTTRRRARLAEVIRDDVNEILTAAGEPPLEVEQL